MTGHAALAIVVLLGPAAGLAAGAWVYRDARRHGHEDWAPYVALVVGGLFVTGSVPGLVALAIADAPAAEGFPTALRIVPALVALAAYAYLR